MRLRYCVDGFVSRISLQLEALNIEIQLLLWCFAAWDSIHEAGGHVRVLLWLESVRANLESDMQQKMWFGLAVVDN